MRTHLLLLLRDRQSVSLSSTHSEHVEDTRPNLLPVSLRWACNVSTAHSAHVGRFDGGCFLLAAIFNPSCHNRYKLLGVLIMAQLGTTGSVPAQTLHYGVHCSALQCLTKTAKKAQGSRSRQARLHHNEVRRVAVFFPCPILFHRFPGRSSA